MHTFALRTTSPAVDSGEHAQASVRSPPTQKLVPPHRRSCFRRNRSTSRGHCIAGIFFRLDLNRINSGSTEESPKPIREQHYNSFNMHHFYHHCRAARLSTGLIWISVHSESIQNPSFFPPHFVMLQPCGKIIFWTFLLISKKKGKTKISH